jgi:hypothetical protein
MYPAVQIIDPETAVKLQLKTTIEFFPGKFLPEFAEAQSLIKQKLENKKVSVEEATNTLIDFFREYEPKKVRVKVDVINNNTFFPVSVIGETKRLDIPDIPADDDSEKDDKKNGKKDGKKSKGKAAEGAEQAEEAEEEEKDES